MLRYLVAGMVVLTAGWALAAEGAPKDDVRAAAKKLAESSNYSWKTTSEMAFGTSTEQGKTEKGGLTLLSIAFGDSTTEAIKSGLKGAIKLEGGWTSLDEAAKSGEEGQFNPARFMAMYVRNHKGPAAIADDLAAKAKEVKKTEEGWSAELTEEGAKDLLAFGPRREDGPQISGAKGSAKFWVKDGVISKLEYQLQGNMKFNDQEMDLGRKVVVEVKDVGSTKVAVPEEAKGKMG